MHIPELWFDKQLSCLHIPNFQKDRRLVTTFLNSSPSQHLHLSHYLLSQSPHNDITLSPSSYQSEGGFSATVQLDHCNNNDVSGFLFVTALSRSSTASKNLVVEITLLKYQGRRTHTFTERNRYNIFNRSPIGCIVIKSIKTDNYSDFRKRLVQMWENRSWGNFNKTLT